jgi:hypothetical protein
MTLSKIYRAKAVALAAQAKSAAKPVHKERFERMALAYVRLAEKYARRLQGRPMRDGTVEGVVEN